MEENVMSGSAHSIVELSRSKTRYHDQDALLRAFIGCAGYTAKEVAVEALDWKYEQYANAPKRAFDLQRLGYLEALPGKLCRQTGKLAHAYRITDKGMEHLRGMGISFNERTVAEVVVPVDPRLNEGEVKTRVSGLRTILGD
jgi:hypothetical protein